MSVILICLADPSADGLDRTLLWRGDVARRHVTSTAEARVLIPALRPALFVIERDLAGAEELIRHVRADEHTRAVSIVVAARGDMRPSEMTLLEAGANAILRLPAGPEWDERLARLARVPLRKAIRVPVHIQLEGRTLLDLASADGMVLNVSTNGMLLECDRPLELFTEMEFSFALTARRAPVVGRGRVVRIAGAARFGVEFLELSADARDQIARLGT